MRPTGTSAVIRTRGFSSQAMPLPANHLCEDPLHVTARRHEITPARSAQPVGYQQIPRPFGPSSQPTPSFLPATRRIIESTTRRNPMTQRSTYRPAANRRHPARKSRIFVGAASAMAGIALVGGMYAPDDSAATATTDSSSSALTAAADATTTTTTAATTTTTTDTQTTQSSSSATSSLSSSTRPSNTSSHGS